MPASEEPLDVDVYLVGIVNASVCAPKEMDPEDVERAVSLRHPTGLDHGWKISDAPTFASGQENPCPCERDPDGRVHRLLTC